MLTALKTKKHIAILNLDKN